MLMNRVALRIYLYSQRKELEKQLSELDLASATVIRACDQLIKNRQQEALATLQEAIQKYPNNRDLRFLQLQTLLDQRNFSEALQACVSLPGNLLHTPALQSLFFALCQHVQDTTLVDKLIDQLESAGDVTEEVGMSTKQATATYFFESQQYELAAKHLQALLEYPSLDSTQRIILTSRLVLATAHTDKAAAIRLGSHLPDVAVVKDMDIDELEDMLRRRDFLKRSNPTPAAMALSQPTTPEPMMEEESVQVEDVVENVRKLVGLDAICEKQAAEKKRKANQKKRARRTARFVATLKEKGTYREPSSLDPERWLAKEDRIAFKRRKKQNLGVTGVGAQGEHVSQSEMDKFDAKKRSENPTVVEKVMVDKSTVRRKKGGRGKKGKK